jgi:tripartite-type tricarboxylate transporter receptor subunit TctC
MKTFARLTGCALALGTFFGALLAAPPVQAQDFSGKPIRMIVGLAAGGATDVMARLIAQKMSEGLKTPVVVENKAGGNFIPAIRELVAQPADGHTLFFISTSTLITQPLHPDYPFDLTKLTAVSQVATGPLILVARNSLGLKSVKDVIDYANKNPGKMTFGAGGGTGSSLYFALELLRSKTNIKVTVVNYRGAGPALNDLLGDHIDAMFDAMPVMVVQAKEGKVTPIAVTSTKRSPALPDVQTMQEAGVPGYEMPGWFGILAPPGVPAEITQKLRDEVAKAVAIPEVVKLLDSQGMQPLGTQPKEWGDYLKSELATYSKMIKDGNLKPE